MDEYYLFFCWRRFAKHSKKREHYEQREAYYLTYPKQQSRRKRRLSEKMNVMDSFLFIE